jgi:pyruvate dehydrogenase (quinone)
LAYPGRQTIALCGDGRFTMLQLGDLPTLVQRKAPVVPIILNNESLGFVKIEQQEAGIVPLEWISRIRISFRCRRPET